MKNAIPLLFAVTAGFATAELAASTLYQSTVLAVDSPTNAHDEAYEGTSTLSVPELNTPFTIEAWLQPIDDYDASGARGVLGQAAIHDYALRPAQVASQHQADRASETNRFILLGLVLIMFGLLPREWRSPLKFRGGNAGLSRARIFQVGGVKLRRRSETELNSFSACYATTRVQAEAPLAGRGVTVAFQRSRTAAGAG